MVAAVTLENVTVSYARHPAVHHISGVFERGTLTAVTGPNGGGKSTLLKAIAGIMQADEGHIVIEGLDKKHIGYLPQASDLQRDFPLSVLHMVCTGAWHSAGGFSSITRGMKTRAMQALAEVGLTGMHQRDLASLSAGQFQRALFARLLMQEASLILLDEPFAAVDADTTIHLLEIVQRWHKEGRTVICVLHDFDQICKFFPRCLLLARECVAWENSVDVLNPERLVKAHFFSERWGNEPEICKQAQ